MSIRIDTSESVATLTIDRPEVKNALDLETVNAIRAALQALAADAGVGVLIITGGGEAAFVSGADINDIRARGRDEGLAAINSSLFAEIERFPRPTIAAVNGYALGGGCELALACDIRIASDTAKFGQPELGLGIIPGAGATQRLPRIIGMGRAKHLILTGEIIDAKQALEIGLVTAVTTGMTAICRVMTYEIASVANIATMKAPVAAKMPNFAFAAKKRTSGPISSASLRAGLSCFCCPTMSDLKLPILPLRAQNHVR